MEKGRGKGKYFIGIVGLSLARSAPVPVPSGIPEARNVPGMWQLPWTLSCSRQPICAASKTLNQVSEMCSSFPGIPLESEPFPARSQKGLREEF